MPNSVISQIVIGSNTYDIKDAYARQLIEDLGDAVYWIGVTTTALTDGATTNPITVGGESVTAKLGGMAQYSGEEFVWNGSAWQSIGKNNFGDLAFADTASGSYTPAGTVEVTPTTADVYSITDVGTLPTVDPTTDSVYSITDVGTLPEMTVSGEVLTFTPGTLPTRGAAQTVVTDVGYIAGTLPTKGAAQAVMTGASASFTGTTATITVAPTE